MSDGETVRAALEEKAFKFLDSEVDVSGEWTTATAIDFFQNFLKEEKAKRGEGAEANPVLSAIINPVDPQRCGRHYLIQFSSDFLSEASAMARLAPGAYGDVQSAIFNILIDEYGASVHANKHSTLFENMFVSVGLSKDVHCYWQFYQPTALSMTNYFHYITKNKRFFFRYIGALFYTESSLVNMTKKQSEMMKRVFSEATDTKYFDEYFHIGQHHGEMALERVIVPAFERFGDGVAAKVVRGFLEFQLLEEIADADLLAQFAFFDGLQAERVAAEKFYSQIKERNLDVALETFVEANGERSTTHTHPDHRLLVIESGTMDFWPLLGEPLTLKAGDILSVPKHRLHESVVTSEECVYHQPIANPDDLAALAPREPVTA